MKERIIFACASILGAALLFSRPVQASSDKTITIAPTYDGKVSLLDKKGNYISNKNVRSNKSYRYYGKPLIIKGKAVFIERVLDLNTYIGKNIYIPLGDGGYVKSENVTSSYEKDGKIYLSIRKNSYIYDKKGKRIKNYHGQSYLKAGSNFQYRAKLASTYNPVVLYNIGKGHYVNAQYVAKVDGKGVARLNHNAYVYDKKGKRVGKTVLGINTLVKYVGKWKKATKNSVIFTLKSDKKDTSYTLPTKKIKGTTYVLIGKNAYVKTVNLELLNGRTIMAKGPIKLTVKHDQAALDSKLNPTTKIYRHSQKLISDYVVSFGYGDMQGIYYHIKGTNYYLDWGPGEEYPDNNVTDQESANFSVRQHMKDSSYLDKHYTMISFNKAVPTYDASGKVTGNLKRYGSNYVADQARYIWNDSDKKAELYYHLTTGVSEPEGDEDPAKGTWTPFNIYVKASDAFLVTGLKLKASNTLQEAEATHDQTVTETTKQQVDSLLAKVNSVKASDKYRLSSFEMRKNYDQAVAALTKAKDNSQTSQSTVSTLLDYVQNIQKRLDGKKIKVKDVNDLSKIEANAVFALMQNVNTGDKMRVTIYTDFASKSGRYQSCFKNSQRSHFVLIDANSKKHDLNVSDYATD